MVANSWPSFIELRFRIKIPLKIHGVKVLMPVKPAEAQSPHVDLEWRFEGKGVQAQYPIVLVSINLPLPLRFSSGGLDHNPLNPFEEITPKSARCSFSGLAPNTHALPQRIRLSLHCHFLLTDYELETRPPSEEPARSRSNPRKKEERTMCYIFMTSDGTKGGYWGGSPSVCILLDFHCQDRSTKHSLPHRSEWEVMLFETRFGFRYRYSVVLNQEVINIHSEKSIQFLNQRLMMKRGTNDHDHYAFAPSPKAHVVVVAAATCLTMSNRGPRNHSRKRARSTPLVNRSFEPHTGGSMFGLGSTPILRKRPLRRRIPIAAGNFDTQFPRSREAPETLILPRAPMPSRHSRDLLQAIQSYDMTAVDFLHHENPPTRAGDEPATYGSPVNGTVVTHVVAPVAWGPRIIDTADTAVDTPLIVTPTIETSILKIGVKAVQPR
ncbi:hypothetical protein TNCV_2804381 [Trichonephila clavipes]|nr:hypothetical protein TNCV_2804381 [Trichonephila clavipes]